jgi:hypothetical protein
MVLSFFLLKQVQAKESRGSKPLHFRGKLLDKFGKYATKYYFSSCIVSKFAL